MEDVQFRVSLDTILPVLINFDWESIPSGYQLLHSVEGLDSE